MTDFAAARRKMVDGQVRTADVTDLDLQAAMLEVPRERFVSARRAGLAYLDLDLPAGDGDSGRCLLKPMVLAKLIQLAEIAPTDRVLDVGCASGYSTAVLARLAHFVVGVEEDAGLARAAESALRGTPTANARIVTGRLADGAPAEGPFDAIIVEGATETAPSRLLSQLKEGGRLVCVLGQDPGKAMLYRLTDGEVSGRPMFDAAAPLLPGFARAPAFVF